MMKMSLYVVLFLLNTMTSRAQDKKGILFEKCEDWNAVLKKAKQERKYIFVDVYTTWCGPCKMMDDQVYADGPLGDLMNKDFISIKVQMDKTETDDSFIKSWYEDAESLKASAKIEAYPTFLFYTPNGELVYKSIGYKDPVAFTKLANFASDPNRKDYKNQLLAYQYGTRDYSKIPDLIKTTRELLSDYNWASVIATDYKKNYLDKLNTTDFMKSENIRFINENGGVSLINVNDQFFYNCYFNPLGIDSILGQGRADLYVNTVIKVKVIEAKLYKNSQPLTKNPNWKSIGRLLQTRYSKVNELKLILDSKVNFYRATGNWELYTRYKSEQIEKYPVKPEGMNVFFALNKPAWDAFLNCEEIKPLKRALSWSDLSLSLEKDSNSLVQFLDTKANLLYKLGNVESAIATENAAMIIDAANAKRDTQAKPFFEERFKEKIDKMKKGIPTWK